jgi:hypothetical protein
MSTVVAKTLVSRRNLFQIVVVASMIAVGVNLLSTWISGRFASLAWLQWFVGGLLIFLGFLFFVQFLIQEKAFRKEMDGLVLLDHSTKALVEIEGYDLSERLDSTLRAAFLENAALRASWESEPIFTERKRHKASPGPSEEIDQKDGSDTKQKVSYRAVICVTMDDSEKPISERSVLLEAVEFCMLQFLSNHLSEYFNCLADEDRHVCTLTRNDAPHILLENRILALLTAPIEDRAIFVDSGISKNPPSGEVHYILGSDGSLYERFDLRLPKGTRFLRPRPGCVRLQHKRFTLDMECAFHGFSESLPTYFEDFYIGKGRVKLDARKVEFDLPYGWWAREPLTEGCLFPRS